MLKALYLLVVSLLLYIPASAQSAVSAEGRSLSVWVGASISSFNPDYGCLSASPFKCNHQLIGIGPFVDTNPLLFHRVGLEGEARFMKWHGPVGLTESSYLVGPRISLLQKGRFSANIKVLVGIGNIATPNSGKDSGNYFVFAPGASLDYRLNRRFGIRGEYEYQQWPNFRSVITGHSGLTPNGFSVGISYKVL